MCKLLNYVKINNNINKNCIFEILAQYNAPLSEEALKYKQELLTVETN